MQSGNIVGPGGYQEQKNFEPHVKDLAKKFNCPLDSSQLIVDCLRKVKANDLAKASNGIDTLLKTGHFVWVPTIESDSPDAFLTSVDTNQMKDLPFMSGTCADEGLAFTARKLSIFLHFICKIYFL